MSLNDAMFSQREFDTTTGSEKPNRNAQLDALENLFKMLDTPIARRKLGGSGMMQEAMEEAEQVLREAGRI